MPPVIFCGNELRGSRADLEGAAGEGDAAGKAVAGDGLEVAGGAEGEAAGAGGGEDGLGDGVFAALFERGDGGEEFVGGKGGVERADIVD